MPPDPLAALAATQTDACGPPEVASWICTRVFRATGNEWLAKAADVAVAKPLQIAIVVVLAVVVSRIVRRAISRSVSGVASGRARLHGRREGPQVVEAAQVNARAVQRAETIGALLRSISSIVIWGIAGITILGELGINLGPLIAGAGIIGIALGFGAQSLVRDFLSGVFMLLEDQYGVGDIVDVGEANGVVEGVSLRTTRLRDVQGTVWYVPNGEIRRVGNKSQQWARALLDISVAYDTDIDRAAELIRGVAVDTWRDERWNRYILEEPEVWGVETLGADGIAIRLVVKTTPADQFDVSRELRARIKRAFDDAGIEIPFPQRTVWVRERASESADVGSRGR